MNQNRKKITYSIRFASISKVVVCTALFTSAGLTYVYLKNQLHQYGDVQRKLEKELVDLKTNNEVVRAQLASLSSRGVLEKKLAKNSLGLMPIANDQIVRLNQRHDPVGDELRVVSNSGLNQ